MPLGIEMPKRARPYIERLRTDPRTRAMFDGWVGQATMLAEQQVPDPCRYAERAHRAAQIALQLAMTHVLDNDGELQAANAEIDKLREHVLQGAMLKPPHLIVTKEPSQ